jgi:anti-sigma B factor antagonist
VLVVKPLEKRLDAYLSADFKSGMISRIGSGNTRIVLDLSQVEFVDSSGLGAIISVLKTLGDTGELALSGMRPNVMSLCRLTRMDRVFQIFGSEQEAVKKLSGISFPQPAR